MKETRDYHFNDDSVTPIGVTERIHIQMTLIGYTESGLHATL